MFCKINAQTCRLHTVCDNPYSRTKGALFLNLNDALPQKIGLSVMHRLKILYPLMKLLVPQAFLY